MIPKELEALGLVPVAGGKSPAYTATKSRLIDGKIVAALKTMANRPGATVRINLHAGPDAPVHNMIIAQKQGGSPYVHKHLTKEETYQMIEGRMQLRMFDDAGKVTNEIVLGSVGSGLPFAVRIPKGVFHATEPRTEYAVFHESRPGPFDPADTVFPETPFKV